MKCCVLKTIILGDCGVGKTTMLYKYYTGKFNSDNHITVGVNFVSKYVENIACDFAESIKLQIWDTAGQERFRSVIRSYYNNVCGCIIVYDITNRNTFNNSLYWMNEVRKNNKSVVIILVGTKTDLEGKREVEFEEGVSLSTNYNIPFFEISSKQCVDNVFHSMVETIINKLNNEDKTQDIKGVVQFDNIEVDNEKRFVPSIKRTSFVLSKPLCCS